MRPSRRKNTQTLYSHTNANIGELVPAILQAGYWLTNAHINHAQWLIMNKYPHAKGSTLS